MSESGYKPTMNYFDPGRVLAYFAHVEEVLDKCPVRLVAASYNKHPWPYRLQHVKELAPCSWNYSNCRIVDSGFGNEDVSNKDVLQKAVEKDATEVVAKDYLAGSGRSRTDAQAKTTESIREFINLHNPNKHPPAWVPLQPPYADHCEEVQSIVENSHLPHRYMLGGLARGERADERIDELLEFRDVAGREAVAHGLGWGPNDDLVELLRENPWLLNSLDNSTPSQCIKGGDSLVDASWEKREYRHVTGKHRDPIGGMFEMAMWLQPAQRLSDMTSDFDGPRIHKNQSTLPGVVADD